VSSVILLEGHKRKRSAHTRWEMEKKLARVQKGNRLPDKDLSFLWGGGRASSNGTGFIKKQRNPTHSMSDGVRKKNGKCFEGDPMCKGKTGWTWERKVGGKPTGGPAEVVPNQMPRGLAYKRGNRRRNGRSKQENPPGIEESAVAKKNGAKGARTFPANKEGKKKKKDWD